VWQSQRRDPSYRIFYLVLVIASLLECVHPAYSSGEIDCLAGRRVAPSVEKRSRPTTISRVLELADPPRKNAAIVRLRFRPCIRPVELLTGLLFVACYFRLRALTVDAFKWADPSLLCARRADNYGIFGERHFAGRRQSFRRGSAGLLFSFFTKTHRWNRIVAREARWFDFPPPQPVLSFADAILGAMVGSGFACGSSPTGYFRLRGTRRAMGLGDVKMMAAVGRFFWD